MHDDPAVDRMLRLITGWEQTADQRAVFLRCYRMMTQNMLDAIPAGEFHDPVWVDRLLHAFANYYFVALEAYEGPAKAAPAVWKVAHDSACEPHVSALQKLLLGVNAHINYDLVLTVADLLREEWAALPEPARAMRHSDYTKVNDIIAETIDAVQDQILEPAMPWMEIVDDLFGRADERMISSLISGWRESVWKNAVCLLECADESARHETVQRVERQALQRADAIGLKNWRAVIGELF